MEFGCWLAALVWASGGDGDVAGAGQQEPAGQREVGGELQQQQQQQWLTAGQVEVAGLLVQGEPRQVHWPIYNKFPPGLYAIYHIGLCYPTCSTLMTLPWGQRGQRLLSIVS